jgi:peptide/nickel transport system ATP-binding protein
MRLFSLAKNLLAHYSKIIHMSLLNVRNLIVDLATAAGWIRPVNEVSFALPIPGTVPQLTALPPGCAFEPRCELRRPECTAAVPALRIASARLAVRCVLV